MLETHRPILVEREATIIRSALRQRAELCRAVLADLALGVRPVVRPDGSGWSDLTLLDGTLVEIGTIIHLHMRSRDARGEVISIEIHDERADDRLIEPDDVPAISYLVECGLASMEAALKGSSRRAVRAVERELELFASREALAANRLEDEIMLRLPTPIGSDIAYMRSDYTKGTWRLDATIAAMADMPWTVMVRQDGNGCIVVEPRSRFLSRRRWTAAYRVGPLPIAA